MHIIKFAAVFALGAMVAFLGIRFVLSSYNPDVLGENTPNAPIFSAEGVRDAQANFVSKLLYDKVLPSIAKSSVLAPFFETKRSIEESVEAVSTLPEAQKNAVCEELCGSAR